MAVRIFLSAVSDEFRAYRDWLRKDLTRHNVEVKVQEDFKDLGRGTLDELDVYIAACDAVVHLVGHMTGAARGPKYAATEASRAAQTAHLRRLREAKRYPGFTFTSPLDQLSMTAVLPVIPTPMF